MALSICTTTQVRTGTWGANHTFQTKVSLFSSVCMASAQKFLTVACSCWYIGYEDAIGAKAPGRVGLGCLPQRHIRMPFGRVGRAPDLWQTKVPKLRFLCHSTPKTIADVLLLVRPSSTDTQSFLCFAFYALRLLATQLSPGWITVGDVSPHPRSGKSTGQPLKSYGRGVRFLN